MISNAEIQRYEEFARIRSTRKIGSPDEQNLALMVLNLVKVIDHLANRAIPLGRVNGSDLIKWAVDQCNLSGFPPNDAHIIERIRNWAQ